LLDRVHPNEDAVQFQQLLGPARLDLRVDDRLCGDTEPRERREDASELAGLDD
jgi:hypothetical protein